MSVLAAALHLARRFPGGIEAVAGFLPTNDRSKPPGSTKSPHSLRHELTADGLAKFGLEDAELLTLRAIQSRVADPLAILNAFAANCGAMVLPLPNGFAVDDVTVTGLAAYARETSEFMSEVAAAVADGKVTDNELAEVDDELGRVIASAQALRTRLAEMNQELHKRAPATNTQRRR